MSSKNKTYVTVDGNEAAAYIAYAFTEIAAIYPITPSSPMAGKTDVSKRISSVRLSGLWRCRPSQARSPLFTERFRPELLRRASRPLRDLCS